MSNFRLTQWRVELFCLCLTGRECPQSGYALSDPRDACMKKSPVRHAQLKRLGYTRGRIYEKRRPSIYQGSNR